MILRLGLENNPQGRSIAWALEYPGCYAYGPDGEAALEAAPAAVQTYLDWMAIHAGLPAEKSAEIEIHLNETFTNYTIDEAFDLAEEGYEVESFFRYDWKPLGSDEIEQGLKILSWSRIDLMEAVIGLSNEDRQASFPGERWNINGILRHVAGAEWWYMDRLGLAFPRKELPQGTFERLEAVRTHLIRTLPGLTGSLQVTGMDGEIWSPRKLLRRAAWHERDHVEHIRKLADILARS